MRATLLLVALCLTATAISFVVPSAGAMSYCVDNSPVPKYAPDCSYYLACAGQYCIDYPCRYCMPF